MTPHQTAAVIVAVSGFAIFCLGGVLRMRSVNPDGDRDRANAIMIFGGACLVTALASMGRP